MFKTKLVLSKVRGHSHKYIVAEPLVWDSNTEGKIVTPLGFTTDLSTFWLEGKHTSAAVLHDYVLELGYGRGDANRVMYRAMTSLEVPGWSKGTIFMGITLYGWYVNSSNWFSKQYNRIL